MLDWLSENSDAASAVLNFAMLLVWIAYLQVFIQNYRRQRQANILISLGGGAGLDARCLVSNMSQEAIYIRSLMLDLTTTEGTFSQTVTEPGDLEEWKGPTDLNLWTRQGPLGSGNVRDMGTLKTILDHARRAKDPLAAQPPAPETEGMKEVCLKVIAHYGPEDLLVAAEQCFAIRHQNGQTWLSPQRVTARQVRSRRERKQLGALLASEIEQSRRPEQ